jgi:hypothetical protein
MCCSALNPHAHDKPPTIKGQIQKGATVANGAAGKENENNAVKKAEVGGNKQETKAPKKESLTEKLYATLTNTLYISNNRTQLFYECHLMRLLCTFGLLHRDGADIPPH